MPLVLHEQLTEDTEMGIWEISETEKELSDGHLLLSEDQLYFNSLKAGKRRMHWLSSRILLKELLGSPVAAEMRTDRHSKPYLINFPHHISISHSADHAAVMISKARRVGIDIEEIQHKIERIAPKFLSNDELSFLEIENRIGQLYACWSAKEALYKLQGESNVSFKENITLLPFAYNKNGKIEAILKNFKGEKRFQIYYRTFKTYMLAWVMEYE